MSEIFSASGGTRRRERAATALAAALLLSACGQKEVAAAPAQTPAAIEAPAGKGPAMWAVSDADSTIYLFGTFHILPATMRWTTPAFDAAMKATPTTMTEVDTTSAAAQAEMARLVQELGLNPPGVTLSSTLGAARAARFAKVVGKYDGSMAAFEPLRPWLAMISLSVLIMQKEGFNAESGAEATILSRAGAQGDKVAHLETGEYQIRALASLDENEILADFDASLDQYEAFDDYTKRILKAWRTGDIAAIETEMLTPMRMTAPGAYKILLVDRNRNWLAEIETMMKGADDVFIAVGAGHLIGDEGVVDMLTEKGYAVTRVQ